MTRIELISTKEYWEEAIKVYSKKELAKHISDRIKEVSLSDIQG